MTGALVPTVGIDDARILMAFEKLKAAGGDTRTMQGIARYMKSSAQLRFRSQTDPDGRGWWPSNRARKEGGQTLRLTGRLQRSLVWRAGPAFAEAGTNVAYAAAHQFGVRKIVTVRAHRRMTKHVDKDGHRMSVRSTPVRAFARYMFLPRRAFLGFSGADRAEILRQLREGIARMAAE